MSADLGANPRLSTWLAVADDGVISLRIGKVELGQGIVTALAQIAADELGVDIGHVRMRPANTALGPNQGVTAGSLSVTQAGAAVRAVCAYARLLFTEAAAQHLGTDPDDVDVHDGRFVSGDAETTYGALAPLVDLDRDIGHAPAPRGDRAPGRLVGTSLPRLDLPGKVSGRARYITDLVLPGQLVGRVVRPPSPAARLIAVDTERALSVDGVVEVVRDGSFLGVVATDQHSADVATEQLRGAAQWDEPATLPDDSDLSTYLRTGPCTTFTVEEAGDLDAFAPSRRVAATYTRPFLAHASISPSAGVALWTGDTVQVWSHSQGVFGLRDAIAAALGLEREQVVVEHAEGAGAYGHNGADDAAFDAVLLARAVPGRPVLVRWTRQDELSWSPLGSAMSIDIAAELDAAGCIVSWHSDIYSQGHTARPGYAGTPGLLAAAHLAHPCPLPAPVDPPADRGAGSARNAVPGYRIPARRIQGHRLDQVALRTSSLRTLGAHANVFAIESMVDELAYVAGRDPLDFRLDHLDDPRARDVLTAVAERAGWRDRPTGGDVARGIGYARYKGVSGYCAAVAEVEAVHDIRVRRLWLAVDVGQVVNPDGVRNQIEGGAVQATSWTLKERVRFDRTRITSTDWESYPILRFSESPEVDVHVLDHPDQPSLGAGEAAAGPVTAAIANAVATALGVRIRDLPITPERVIAALES